MNCYVGTVSTNEPCFIGVDPGASGGLVCLQGDKVRITKLENLSLHEVWSWISDYLDCQTFAVIEKVGGHVGGGPICPVCKQARNHSPGSAMFNFGFSAGTLTAMLVAASIPYEEIIPRTWQKGLNIPTKDKDETNTKWKNRLKAKAQQLYPNEHITLKTADALLIATYCQRRKEGLT